MPELTDVEVFQKYRGNKALPQPINKLGCICLGYYTRRERG